jgi:hypothetical protein
VIGRHIGNILVFWTLRRNPGFACGRVELDHRYVLRTSAFHSAGLVLPLLALAALEPSPLTFGFALAPLRTAVFMYQWEAKYNKRLAKAAAAKPEAPEPQPASSVPARPTTNN